MKLNIRHIRTTDRLPVFSVEADNAQCTEFTLTPPAHYEIDTHGTKLDEGLRWYLEDYPIMPDAPNKIKAGHVMAALTSWGSEAYKKLVDNIVHINRKEPLLGDLEISIISNDATILTWPWEALGNGDVSVGQLCSISRIPEGSMSEQSSPDANFMRPESTLNILYIIARPQGDEVGYRKLAKPIIDLLSTERGYSAIHLDLLRPPTFQQLKTFLKNKGRPYHIVHFDGHGVYGLYGDDTRPQGYLLFEKHAAEHHVADYISAAQFAEALKEHNIPIVLLNACRSAMTGMGLYTPHASISERLIKAGVQRVVAMGYMLQVAGASAFFPAFYETLCKSGNIINAVAAGRYEMYLNNERTSMIGDIALQDWLVPVLYQNGGEQTSRMPLIEQLSQGAASRPTNIVHTWIDPFTGRDAEILQLERAVCPYMKRAGIIIHGMAGVGKTSLIKEFVKWLFNTNGLADEFLYFDASTVHSVSEMITIPISELREARHLIILDSFEQLTMSDEERKHLIKLFAEIQGGQSKLIMVSRDSEKWLPDSLCIRLPVTGFDYNETHLLKKINLATKTAYTPILRLLGLHVHAAFTNFIESMIEESEKTLPDVAHDEVMACFLYLERMGLCHPMTEGVYLLHPALQDYLHQTHPASMADKQAFMMVMGALAIEYAPKEYYQQHNIFIFFHANLYTALKLTYEHRSPLCTMRLLMGLASYAYNIQDYEKAEVLYCELAKWAKEQAGSYHVEGNAYLELARIMDARYEIEKAEAWCEKAISLYAANNEYLELANVYHHLGNMYFKQRSYSEAEEWHTQSLKLREQHGEKGALTGAYCAQGDLAYGQLKYANAIEWYLRALSIEKEHGHVYNEASIYHQLGLSADAALDWVMAEKYFMQALKIYHTFGNELGAAKTYNHLGIIASKQYDFESAQTWYERAYKIWQSHEHEAGISGLSHQLGIASFELGDFYTAYMWYKKALEFEMRERNRHSVAITFYQLGKVAAAQKDFTASEDWYKDAMTIWTEIDDLYSLATTYNDLGILYAEQNRFDEARIWYDEALAICQRNEYEQIEALVYNQLGNLVIKQSGDLSDAEAHLIKAFNLLEKIGDYQNADIIKGNLINIKNERRNLHA